MRLRDKIPNHVTIGISGDALAATGLNAGCEIWYSVIGGIFPNVALALTKAARTGDAALAIQLSDNLTALWNSFKNNGGSLRVVAAIAEEMGLVSAPSLPLPLYSIQGDERKKDNVVDTYIEPILMKSFYMLQRKSTEVENVRGLLNYVLAASLARAADGGAVVGVVLLAMSNGASGAITGILGACITAPHFLGPFVARKIDTSDDGRKVIALACLVYAVVMTIAALSYGHISWILSGVLFSIAGICGPLLTGGISSRLSTVAGETQQLQRRSQGWDVASYGIGGTIGPSIVAGMSAYASPRYSCYQPGYFNHLSCDSDNEVTLLPPQHGGDLSKVPSTWAIICVMLKDIRLRQTLYLTMLVAFAVSALPITAVKVSSLLGEHAASAAVLTAAYGIGNLAGSVFIMRKPLYGDPGKLMITYSIYICGGLFAIISCSSIIASAIAFLCTGILNSYFFAATLIARTEYAPAQGKGQVFLWVAAMKISAGSAGTAIAGILIEKDMKIPIVAGIILVVTGAVVAWSSSAKKKIPT